MKGVTKRTLQHHDLTKYLIAFMIHNGSHTQFTSISIVQGDSLKVKHDPLKHRIGSFSVIALGDFKGGELWVQDESPIASTEVTAQDGTNMSGRLVSIASKAAVFDSSKQHKTMPWDGERWTITAYSSSAYDQLEASQVECLRQAGFPLRDQKKEFPSSPGIPTRDMTLFELATMDDPAPRPAEPRIKPKVKLKATPKMTPDPKAKPGAKASPSSSSKVAGKDKGPEVSRLPEGVADVPDGPPPEPAPPGGSDPPPDTKGIEALKKEAKSIHHLMTHIPKNPFCDVCKRAKMYKPPSYKVNCTRTIEAKSFGDHIAADHVIIRRDKETEIEESRLALVVKDVKTAFMYAYPSALKSEEEEECIASLQHFVSSADKVGNFYSDNAKELKSAAKKLGWRHELSKAHIHQSNAVAERAVRATTEGTRSNLLQAGISHVYWPHALEHSCTAFNISHPNGIEYSPWKKRFGSAFPGKILPFGCRIDYWVGPKTQRKDRERVEPTAEPGIFLGYNFQPGMKWRKEVLVLPIKDVVRNDYHEYITPVRAYNFTIPEGDFVFPMKDRGDKVALGQATDALERPSVDSLTNQDAEPAVEAPSDVPQAEAERRIEVIDPKTGKLVPIPEAGRYYDAGGTLGRRYGGQRGSTKPDSIPSALWPTMSKQQKAKAREEVAREQARALANFQEGGSSSSSAPPAAVARDDKDNWEIVGSKLTRYH